MNRIRLVKSINAKEGEGYVTMYLCGVQSISSIPIFFTDRLQHFTGRTLPMPPNYFCLVGI